MESTVMHGGRVLNHHAWGKCMAEACPLHNPSDHSMRNLPLDWNSNWGVMVRVTGEGTFEIDPDEYRLRNLKPGQSYILQNSGYCKVCKVELISTHRHDFVSCPCGEFVDGGHDYLRSTTGLTNTSVVYTKPAND